MGATFASEPDGAVPIHVIGAEAAEDWIAAQPPRVAAWARANGFSGALGSVLVVPAEDGSVERVLAGWGRPAERARGRFHFGALVGALPEGVYRLAEGLGPEERDEAALAWLAASYRFDRYKKASPRGVTLVAPEGVDAHRTEVIAAGVARTADLINTPASDMGPDALETAFADLAGAFGAGVRVTRGADLLDAGFPLIHAVGRASAEAPRLLDMTWGRPEAPRVTLVGKGVCFDTGGLNLKPGSSMALMKKDMGGAANVMGLAHMVMALDLPVRLRVLVPAVENAVSGASFRPGDVLTSRKGLTVEVNNTDAEGRLVLADALALADEEAPGLMVSMATLTGAARVALGPDLAPLFTDDDALAGEIAAAGRAVADPTWRLPFWPPYEKLIEPEIADLDNAPKGGFAGAITAALFLRRFVEKAGTYAHFDIYGWTPSAQPGRPVGGASQGARALLEVIGARYGGAG